MSADYYSIDPMKESDKTLLDQIKNDVAREYGAVSMNKWSEAEDEDMYHLLNYTLWPIVCERYATAKAQASCEATLKKAADKVCKDDEKWILPIGHKLIQISITDPNNITIV